MPDLSEDEIQDLTDRVFLLKEQLQEGKVAIAPELADELTRSLQAVRLRGDGKVDPETVDGRVRALTLALLAMRHREQAKRQVSLAEIQGAYFKLLFLELGALYRSMKDRGATPAAVANAISADHERVRSIIQELPALVERLQEFWSAVSNAASYHLQDSGQLKAAFAGDLFPAYGENAVSTAGLYVDTIILPCPVMRIAPLIGQMRPEQVVRYFIKHALSAMDYRDLAVAEVEPPIVLIIPNTDDTNNNDRRGLIARAERFQCMHGGRLFGRGFESVEHLADFCSSLKTVDQVIAELKDPDRLLFDTQWERDPRRQLERAVAGEHPLPTGVDPAVAGAHVLAACLGRLPQALETQEKALRFGATPFINAETSWLYYTWLLEYEGAEREAESNDRKSLHIVRALSEGNANLEWLGNVPAEAVLDIRRRGLADEVRALLSKGVGDLVALNPDNFSRTADQVVDNLQQAFLAHQQQLAEAKANKLRLYGVDVGSCVAVGGIAVAAALTANPGLGALSGVLGVAGLPNLKDIRTKFREISEADKARRASPTGILFRHVKK